MNGIAGKSDHDLIVEMHTDLRYVREDIRGMKEQVRQNDDDICDLKTWKATMQSREVRRAGLVAIVASLFGGAIGAIMSLIFGRS